MGDEPLPGPDRHRARRAPRTGDRDRGAPGGAEGLPDAPELHVSVRTDLDHRDREPTAHGVVARYPGVDSWNSLPSGSTITTEPSGPGWIRVAPRATSRSTSPARSPSTGATSKWSRS